MKRQRKRWPIPLMNSCEFIELLSDELTQAIPIIHFGDKHKKSVINGQVVSSQQTETTRSCKHQSSNIEVVEWDIASEIIITTYGRVQFFFEHRFRGIPHRLAYVKWFTNIRYDETREAYLVYTEKQPVLKNPFIALDEIKGRVALGRRRLADSHGQYASWILPLARH